MRDLYRLHALVFFGVVPLVLSVVFIKAWISRSPVAFFAAGISFHMAWIAVSKAMRREGYERHRLFHDASCIYMSLLSGVIAIHVWPLRAGSPMNALWGGIRHSLIGVVLGAEVGVSGSWALVPMVMV